MPNFAVRGGPKIFAENVDRLTEPVKKAEETNTHLWVMTGLWSIQNATLKESVDGKLHGVHLDLENLLTVDGPGCFICEKPWEPGMEDTPCTGDPSRLRSKL